MVLRYKTSIYENIVNPKKRISFLSNGRLVESNVFFLPRNLIFFVPGNNTTTIAAGSVTKTLIFGKWLVK